MKTIGIQGIEGSFSEEAAKSYCQKFGITDFELEYLVSSMNVLDGLTKKTIDTGIFAMENAQGGVVIESVEALAKNQCKIIDMFYVEISQNLLAKDNIESSFTDLKILDKISSKNTLVKLKNGELFTFKDLSIKSLKCKNSEFDDNPEITAYIQVKDLTDENNNEVFVFNGWMFSSSPSITPFDHPVYDVWLIKCY